MKLLFALGNQYMKESDWKDMALVKFCLCAMGVLLGLGVKEKHRPKVTGAAAGIFAVTYILLMVQVGELLLRRDEWAQ